MLVFCVTSWQTYGREWNVWYLWHRLDWISRLDVFVLAAMLAYVAIVFGRDSYCCREALREPGTHVRALIVDLNRRVRVLRSFATAAPYLGLAGTCFGILDSFRGVGMQRDAAIAMYTTNLVASLLTTASGLLVALSAAASSNYLLWLLELELNIDPNWRSLANHSAAEIRVFSKYPLRKQFSKLPAFALMAAPCLAVVLAVVMSFSSFRRPMGLEVRLLQTGAIVANNNSRVQPLFIGLSNTSGKETPEIYLDSKRTTWDNLDSSVCNNLKTQPQPTVYVESDNDVRWAYVAMVIDSVRTHCDDVVLLTTTPEVGSNDARRSGRSKKSKE